MAMIEFQDIHKWYGEFHVLKGISEKVEKGEVLVICGPSGSGKSTLHPLPQSAGTDPAWCHIVGRYEYLRQKRRP